MHTLGNDLKFEQTTLVKTQYDLKNAINDGSLFLMGNGYLGMRGTFMEGKKTDYAGIIVTDTWDNADGKWEELSTVMNGLFADLRRDGQSIYKKPWMDFKRSLDLATGITTREVTIRLNDVNVTIKEEKFASMDDVHVIPMRVSVTADGPIDLNLSQGIDADVWSLNGTHLKDVSFDSNDLGLYSQARLSSAQDTIAVATQCDVHEIVKQPLAITSETRITLSPDTPYTWEQIMVVTSSNETDDPNAWVQKKLKDLDSYDTLKTASIHAWEEKWAPFNVRIKGDDTDDFALKFNTYHALIATPTHKPLPIGARGLSAQSYQGAAFWDQEIYNMPMYLYANPEVAKNLLLYRYHTLDGAREKAKKHGYEGAFYAWISGKTGKELCPDFFFKDVLSGRPIRNHFNLWQIHISFDVGFAILRYVKQHQDAAFMRDYGLEMLIEISRFLASRVAYIPHRDRYELIRVQGPDEYHENVDNNAFTNYQAHYVLKETLKALEDYTLQNQAILPNEDELKLWQSIEAKLYLPKENEDGLIEQFDGYFALESIVPAHKVTERLIDPEEYYGYPNGITVFTQCLKQADTVQLFSVHPELFDEEVQRTNYHYYEPRTLHFSSLSPTTHALVAARLGLVDEAYKHMKKALFIDLLSTNEAVSGGTFIGGMHTANNGASWAVVAEGFAGVAYDNGLVMNPHLPKAWESITLPLYIDGALRTFEITHKTIKRTDQASGPITIWVQGTSHTLKSGEKIAYTHSS